MVFAFFASESSYLAQNIIVPYFPFSPVYIHLALTLLATLFIIYFTVDREIYFDLIALLLFVRMGASILPAVYIGAAGETLGRVTVPLITFLAYFIGRQYKGQVKWVLYANVFFVLILAVQTFYTVRNMVVPNASEYALYIKIPIASSNAIAALITPCIFLVLLGFRRNSALKYVVMALLFVSVVLTTSQGAFLVMAGTALIYYLYLNKKIDLRIKIAFAVLIVMAAILAYAILNRSLNELTHARSSLVQKDMMLWTEHMLFGNGMVYAGRGAGSHNIVVDLFVQNGLIGLILYIVPLVMVFKRLLEKKIRSSQSIVIFLIAALLYSMIETSYFSYVNDMIFWFMAGAAVSLSQTANEKQEFVSQTDTSGDCLTPDIVAEEKNPLRI
jgi:hypothetical protein